VARQEDLGVDDAELSYFVTQQAQQMGVEPELLARQITEGGQIGAAAAEVLRGKAMALLASRVKIQDEAGHELDYNALLGVGVGDEDAGEGGEDAGDAEDAGEAMEAAGTGTDAAAETDADAAAGTDADAEDSAGEDAPA